MKIEVGENLIRSWLRHIEGCQFAELNWKASSSWEARGDVTDLLEAARTHFANVTGADIFGGQTGSQLLRQAEVDVLGLRVGKNGAVDRIYSVDMAFHERGLNYGGVRESVSRVLKKLLRSMLMVHFVFGPLPLQVVFASPRVGRSYFVPLEEGMQSLDRFLATQNITCETSLLVNETFRGVVLDPVLAIATDVADTSELFLRSYQLMQLFRPRKSLASTIDEKLPATPADTLKFRFDPGPADRFKTELLRTKAAEMTIHYQDGRSVRKIWNAPNFQESSSLLGNLRSRPEFRQGAWQRSGIASVDLRITL